MPRAKALAHLQYRASLSFVCSPEEVLLWSSQEVLQEVYKVRRMQDHMHAGSLPKVHAVRLCQVQSQYSGRPEEVQPEDLGQVQSQNPGNPQEVHPSDLQEVQAGDSCQVQSVDSRHPQKVHHTQKENVREGDERQALF